MISAENQATQDATHSRGTLTARPGFSASKPPRKPFVAKGHDAILKDFQDTGASVEVFLISSDIPLLGRVTARDKFTITLMLAGLSIKRTIYKHAIESFGPAA